MKTFEEIAHSLWPTFKVGQKYRYGVDLPLFEITNISGELITITHSPGKIYFVTLDSFTNLVEKDIYKKVSP